MRQTTLRPMLLCLALLAVATPGARHEVAADGLPAGVIPVLDEAAKARAAALDGQFSALKAAGSEEAAATIVAEIWSLWMQSGDAAIDEMIREASVAMSVGAAIRADRLLEEILKRRPDYAEAWNKRATLRFLQRRFEESLADCLEVLNREPRHFGALAGMGLIAIEQDNFKAALAAFRRAQAIHPFLGERALIPALEQKVEGKAL